MQLQPEEFHVLPLNLDIQVAVQGLLEARDSAGPRTQ
jgi:hypothetical protein